MVASVFHYLALPYNGIRQRYPTNAGYRTISFAVALASMVSSSSTFFAFLRDPADVCDGLSTQYSCLKIKSSIVTGF